MAELALRGGAPVRAQPFHRWPDWDATDRGALERVLEAGSWGGFPSPNTEAKRFADAFAAHTGAKHGICCTNGSVAIELALQALGLEPGDEVIVPAYTFVATASSVVFCHGVPVFADVDPRTYCIDPAKVEAAITPRTKGIVVVHLACNMADMDGILTLARERGLWVIEDCAHAHGHRWEGEVAQGGAGSLGDVATFSFQTSKLMTAGEGGIVLTSDDTLAQRLHSLVNCGRKEPGYDRFEGRLMGKNSRITEWQAALLSAGLARLDDQTARREANAALLEERLSAVPGLSFTTRDPRNTRRAIYQFIVRYDPAAFAGFPRDTVLEALRAEGIPCEGDFYVPLYEDPLFAMDRATNPLASLPYGEGFDLASFSCPVTAQAAYREAIWLPHYLFLGPAEDMDDVATAFAKVQANAEALQA